MSEDKSPTDKVDHGRCLCGAVTFTVVGEPIYNVVCHCENCRRHGGSTLHCASIFPKKVSSLPPHHPASFYYNFSSHYTHYTSADHTIIRQQYTLHTGAESITTYEDRATQSGQPLSRAFCKICGSKVYSTTPLNKDIVSLPAGVLDGVVTQWAPHKEQFCDVRCDWVPELGDGIKERFRKGPTGSKVDGLTSKV
ncbi:hypothetical protein AYL99_07648 [Fonsecaea erecta]|uniref:CENP-V/GFA domain-containing protein n=1 Tax=Fonsecaea erecta TaxID=1367422 RepID=A0A178ZFM2_9EURO|nr:hypothetical protein AYL99_07648 [Fonsecaea erecta]OAP58558.1 hypothetical protein AYL99_07648 [Fonsecaea erecta]